MSSPGTDAGRRRPLDPNLAKALSHPLRQRILERLCVSGEASPSELSRALDARVANVAYHVRVLVELDCVELVRTRQHRGALESYYRALAHPWLDAKQWAQLPASFRRQSLARTLRDIVADASAAGIAGGFDRPDAQLRRVDVGLDEQGWHEAAELVAELLTSMERVHADSASRAAKDQAAPPTIDAEIALLLFQRPPDPSEAN